MTPSPEGSAPAVPSPHERGWSEGPGEGTKPASPAARSTLLGALSNERVLFFVAMAAVALPRLLALPFAQDFYGDAAARGEIGGRFAVEPHFFGSFAQGAYQFGPLQLYLLGALDWLGVARDEAGRLSSLVFGALTAWPLWALTRRLFGVRAAAVACLGLAAWGLQVQFSTTGGSEALALCLLCASVAAFARALADDDRAALFGSALLLTLACATRYDAWLYVPFLGVSWVVVRGWKSWKRAFAFMALSSAFPLGWMHGNWADLGDPFYPLRFIDDFHRHWFPDGDRLWGVWEYRLQNLFFWPGAALVTLSPLVALLGAWGLVVAWRAKQARWLVALVVLPALLFTVRSTLLASFVPLARFTAKELLFLLPFVPVGAGWLAARLPKLAWRPLAALTVALAVAFPVGLVAYTYDREGKWENTVRPVSPITTQPRELVEAVKWVRAQVTAHGGSLVLDGDDRQYFDVTVGFRSGLPEDRLARARWDTFPVRLTHRQPRYLLRFEGGMLEHGQLKLDGETAVLGPLTWPRGGALRHHSRLHALISAGTSRPPRCGTSGRGRRRWCRRSSRRSRGPCSRAGSSPRESTPRPGDAIGPGGSPNTVYVLYGCSNSRSDWRIFLL